MPLGKAAAAAANIFARAVVFGASLLVSSEATAKRPFVDDTRPTISAPLVLSWM